MPGSGDNGTVRTLAMVAGRVTSPGRCHCHHVRSAWGEWDAYAGVGLVGQCGAA